MLVQIDEKRTLNKKRDGLIFARVYFLYIGCLKNLSELTVIEGGAKGVDTLAAAWAGANGVGVETHKADWKCYGRGAAHRRNAEMAAAADFVLIHYGGMLIENGILKACDG